MGHMSQKHYYGKFTQVAILNESYIHPARLPCRELFTVLSIRLLKMPQR